MYLFILGRQPEISLAELMAVFGNAELILPDIALVKSSTPPDINRLGGTRKIGQIIYDNDGEPGKFLNDKFTNLPPGKITLGVSHYGRNVSLSTARKTGIMIKKKLSRSMRILPNTTAEISDAATLGNKLGTVPNKVELLMAYIGHRLIIAELIGVQDLNAYTLRDRGRPRRDAHVGMLPPKLAQIMINLALAESLRGAIGDEAIQGGGSLTLLDPFCGTGVVLQEALLMGFSVYGTDISPRMIDYTHTNLDWLTQHPSLRGVPHHFRESGVGRRSNPVQLEAADATNHKWTQPIDIVVSETYLGQPYSTPPPMDKLKQNMSTCNTIIEKFLANIAPQLAPGTPLCLAIPAWFVGNKTYHLPIIKKLDGLGYSVHPKPSSLTTSPVAGGVVTGRLIYRRDNQTVGRQLLVLTKK